jgi:hypothetical protein
MTRKLIVTADDYGMCNAINEAIDECLSAGVVRATCVMANMPARDAAASLRKRFPHASIGIHWTLTQGRALRPASQIPSLVSSDGEFYPVVEFRRRWLLRRVRLSQLRAELRAQYQRFHELAGAPDFWNTHENVHLLPGLFAALVALGRELRIPAMRCHRRLIVLCEGSQARYNLQHPLAWLKGHIIARWSGHAEVEGVLMPDGRTYVRGRGVGPVPIEDVVKRLDWSAVRKAVEMVVHPATAVDERLFGSMTESRVLEYQILRDRELAKRLRHRGVETVGFEVLANHHHSSPSAPSRS